MSPLALTLASTLLLSQDATGVKDGSGWTYYGPKIQTGDHWIWHRKREEFAQTGLMDKTSVPEDKNVDLISQAGETTSSRLMVRDGFAGRSAGVEWTLLKGTEWKGSQKINKPVTNAGRGAVSLGIPGGFRGFIFRKTTKEEWYEAFKVGTKRETRAIYAEKTELLGVLVPAGFGFDTSSGEVVKIQEPK